MENPQLQSDPYPAAGIGRDYFDLARQIPVSGRLQVLTHWDGR